MLAQIVPCEIFESGFTGRIFKPMSQTAQGFAVVAAGVNFRMRRRSPRTLDCPCGFVEKHKRKGRSYFPQPRISGV
jgi:hypothetical protein